MPDFVIKQNDTAPIIKAYLQDENGDAVNISGASVDFHMSDYSSTVINSPATIEDETGGLVSYTWQSEDTTEKGNYKAEFEVTFADGSIETFPNTGYIEIKINAEIS